MRISRRSASCLAFIFFCQFLFMGTAWQSRDIRSFSKTRIFASSQTPEVSPEDDTKTKTVSPADRNSIYIGGLMDNLSGLCDKYIISGSEKVRAQLLNVLDRISAESFDDNLIRQSIRMVKRAGVPFMESNYTEKLKKENELGKTDSQTRRKEVDTRKQWEEQRTTSQVGSNVANSVDGRSALSKRSIGSQKPDLFMPSVLNANPDSIAKLADEKTQLQSELENSNDSSSQERSPVDGQVSNAIIERAANRVSQLIAKAGAGSSFEGEALGIGGLDDVLAQVKRRVWTPLAAPPQLLEELGIHPVRGLLLYGRPGCGKTLLARTLGQMLSPMRPITVVSGPEIMDKFVGSSEKNLRDIFDNPPDIYDTYRLGEADGGNAIATAALHVVVMDEFDAVARARGGRGGKGDQGDAGVARDSVVNQLLAKMDGVHPLPVPTLVIGLTNKRSLIEPALLRSGRFEVQVEVPPPKTIEQRVSILKVHTKSMHKAGRLLVSDPPADTAAAKHLKASSGLAVPMLSYNELMSEIAKKCEGYSGASLAGVARAAASHALERAVDEFSQNLGGSANAPSIMDCLVTPDDFSEAVDDVLQSMGSTDYEDDEDKEEVKDLEEEEDPISPE